MVTSTSSAVRVIRRWLVVAVCTGLVVAGVGVEAARPAVAGSGPVGYGPPGLQAAYALPSAADGAGVTVAVVAPFDDPDVAGDLAAYREQYGQPACSQTLSVTAPECLTVVNESGALITPGSGAAPGANTSWALRTSAQLDAVSAVCPNCKLLLVEVDSAAIPDVGAGVNFAAALGAQVITVGVAQPETSADLTWDGEYFDHPGVAITAAAGDAAGGSSGFSASGVNYPAASQYVTAVGGTTLNPVGAGGCTAAVAGRRGYCETPWDDADGASVSGCSLYEPEPAWQKAGIPAGDTGCGSLRSVADVSADADPVTGIAVYDSYNEDGWQDTQFGGTAVAAAIVAGVYALAGTAASDVDRASSLYANAIGFNDITTGANGTCSPAYLCTAGSGYDGPTGLGTPDGDIAFFSGYQPGLSAGPAAYDPETGDEDLFAAVASGTGFEDSRSSAGTWSGWLNMSGSITGRPSAVFDPLDGAMEVYGRGPGGAVYEDYQLPGQGWSGWSDKGGPSQGSPSAVYDPLDHALEIYLTGTNGTVWQDTATPAGSWLAKNMGGVLSGSPDAVYDPANQTLQVWGSGTNGTVWMNSMTSAGSWAGWKNMGGDISGAPSVVYDPLNGAMEAYGRGPGGAVYEDYQLPGQGWSGWSDKGGPSQGSPSAVYDPLDHALEIYLTGTNGTVWQDSATSVAGSWSGKNMGGVLSGSPDAVYDPASSSLDVAGLSTNGAGDVNSLTTAGSWSGWKDLGGILASL
jgi:hypothetical protein